jgi:hypothetical protein
MQQHFFINEIENSFKSPRPIHGERVRVRGCYPLSPLVGRKKSILTPFLRVLRKI